MHYINMIISKIIIAIYIMCFQELKAKVAEEISRMRYFITGQRSGTASPGNADRSASEVEVLIAISSSACA